MRCYICNAINAEVHDKRDDKFFCDSCAEDNIQTAWEQTLEFDYEESCLDEEYDLEDYPDETPT